RFRRPSPGPRPTRATRHTRTPASATSCGRPPRSPAGWPGATATPEPSRRCLPPPPGTCLWGYGGPLIGGNAELVLYEGHNCAGGKNELYLASMKCGVHYLVDNVRPRDD